MVHQLNHLKLCYAYKQLCMGKCLKLNSVPYHIAEQVQHHYVAESGM